MSERSALIDEFLIRTGWVDVKRSLLAADASFRQYERIKISNKTAILMDAPPPKENIRPFIKITEHLAKLGYSVPQIFAKDIDAGFLLLEDFGDETFTKALTQKVDEMQLYQSAIDVLINLHSRELSEVIPDGVKNYDHNTLLGEVVLFVDWYIPGLFGDTYTEYVKNDFLCIWEKLLSEVSSENETLVLRDFHADNLMWLPSRDGIRKCGLLDYQDAVKGSPAYDIASLLEDARRDLKPGMASDLLDYYFTALPKVDRRRFNKIYAILSAQRHCKVIGIFARLAMRDGKRNYLKHINRCWRLLERVSSSPELKVLDDWLNANIPVDKRTGQIVT